MSTYLHSPPEFVRPLGTLRLQLHANYTLDDAVTDLPYFSRLGVSHLYLSPVSRARPGSMHGYDVVDHTCVDPERGGEAALRRLAEAAQRAGMGILLDIVPNHMATDPNNAWWWDVLKHGKESRWANWFDIDWNAQALSGKVLAPFLGKPYEGALQDGDVRLAYDGAHGLHVAVHEVPYPLAPNSLEAPDPSKRSGDESNVQALEGAELDAVLARYDVNQPEGYARLHALLERQHYRLAWWREAPKIINWRRFFEESGLIGVRVEEDEVFEAVHALPLRLYAEGIIDGLRIDHVDGLARPLAYCRRLHDAMNAARPGPPGKKRSHVPWIVVEKILAAEETMDDRWAVSGTTGYDFAADVGALLHDGEGHRKLFEAWSQIANDERPPHAWVTQARQELLSRHFIAERNALLDVLSRLSPDQPRGWSRPTVGRMLDALLHHFPTYRSYVDETARAEADQAWFDRALEGARSGYGHVAEHNDEDMGQDLSDLSEALLTQLDQWLGREAARSADAREAIRRFQQLTPPLAAKSLEDTVFYRYGCLLSRNEVGSDPSVFAITTDTFHDTNVRRANGAPYGLLATATHDHKRGEDVRARLAALSEIPDTWLDASQEWLGFNQEQIPEGGPILAFRYMLLQTLVGAWASELSAHDGKGVGDYLERICQWTIKALREGKQTSSWFDPQLEHEEACLADIRALAPGQRHHSVLVEIEALVRRLEPAAIANSLIQTALRMTCPGVPDLYQGTEFRDFSLVDPDNRRPVDYAARSRALAGAGYDDPATLPPPLFSSGRWDAEAWADGRVKQALVAALLRYRRAFADAFDGGYRPLEVTGDRARHVLAFARGDGIVVISAVKCAAAMQLDSDGIPVLSPDFWGDTVVSMPTSAGSWHDLLRERSFAAAGPQRVADLLIGFPLAVIRREAQG